MNEEERIPIIEQKEAIKLTRSVTGKIGWEIKVLIPYPNKEGDGLTLTRLEYLDTQLKLKFGEKNE